jgi:cytochrome c peroxidase
MRPRGEIVHSLRSNWAFDLTLRLAIGALLLASVVLAGCAPKDESVQDGSVFSPAERGILTSVSLQALLPVPASPSNRVANNAEAAALGKALFFDPRLSGAGDQSCATCHQPDKQFTDGRVTGKGVNVLGRNTPTVIGGAWQTWFYWDGRRDSLWAQAIIPIEAPDEMAGSRLATVRLIASDQSYRTQYEALFGPLPESVTSNTLPPHGGPLTQGDAQAAWYGLSDTVRTQVNLVYANAGKAIAAYERTLVPQPSAFDQLMDAVAKGDDAGKYLSEAAQAGARLFADIDKTGCLQCHNGALLTNGDFHNVGSGSFRGEALDFGRMFGVQSVQLDPFNCVGVFSDALPDECLALRFLSQDDHGDTAGAFKVPTLRNIAQTAPYFHDGRFATLAEVVAHYNEPPTDQEHELEPLALDETEIEQLVAFLESLSSATYPAPVNR